MLCHRSEVRLDCCRVGRKRTKSFFRNYIFVQTGTAFGSQSSSCRISGCDLAYFAYGLRLEKKSSWTLDKWRGSPPDCSFLTSFCFGRIISSIHLHPGEPVFCCFSISPDYEQEINSKHGFLFCGLRRTATCLNCYLYSM